MLYSASNKAGFFWQINLIKLLAHLTYLLLLEPCMACCSSSLLRVTEYLLKFWVLFLFLFFSFFFKNKHLFLVVVSALFIKDAFYKGSILVNIIFLFHINDLRHDVIFNTAKCNCLLIFGNNLSCLLNVILTETLFTGLESGLLISVLGKLYLFYLIV